MFIHRPQLTSTAYLTVALTSGGGLACSEKIDSAGKNATGSEPSAVAASGGVEASAGATSGGGTTPEADGSVGTSGSPSIGDNDQGAGGAAGNGPMTTGGSTGNADSGSEGSAGNGNAGTASAGTAGTGPTMDVLGNPADWTPVFKQFVDAKKAGTEPVLPDFSYAGYEYSTRPIPDVQGPVFQVDDYGANPNDTVEDVAGIQAAVDAARDAGGGVVLFSAGRYLVSEKQASDPEFPMEGEGGPNINIARAHNVVLRGAGSGDGGTELYMKYFLRTHLISGRGGGGSDGGAAVDAKVTATAPRETFKIGVSDTSELQVGDMVIFAMEDTSAADAQWVAPHPVENEWSRYQEGQLIRERHEVAAIDGNEITTREPFRTTIDAKYNYEVRKVDVGKNFGIEDIRFVGNWKEPFDHHKNFVHDNGWMMVKIDMWSNVWLRRLEFVDVSFPIEFRSVNAATVQDVVHRGNYGHNSVVVNVGSFGVLVRDYRDETAGVWHSPGIVAHATGNVFLDCTWPETTTFDSHGVFPYATLFDRIHGGLTTARSGSGGAQSNLPNHLRHLVLWNFDEKGSGANNYKFWNTSSQYRRFVMPLLVGKHGANSSFDDAQLQLNESLNEKVAPDSLFEAQLYLRLNGYD